MTKYPINCEKKIFEKLFETAEIAKFTPDQVRSYEDSLKYYRDLKNSIDTAREEGKTEGLLEGKEQGLIEGKEQGKLEGKIEIAKNLLNSGISIEIIQISTGLSEEEIRELL